MKNLNKESFFNRMQEQYPEAMAHFCAWVDQYKKSVNWDSLFNHGIGYLHEERKDGRITGQTMRTEAPKFHDLPHEFQIGIILKYVCETGSGNFPAIKDTEDILEKAFTNFKRR